LIFGTCIWARKIRKWVRSYAAAPTVSSSIGDAHLVAATLP